MGTCTLHRRPLQDLLSSSASNATSFTKLHGIYCSWSALQERLSGVRIELVPIDHGFCLPEALEAPFFEWLYWGQASGMHGHCGIGHCHSSTRPS